jgi:hypothetical protein
MKYLINLLKMTVFTVYVSAVGSYIALHVAMWVLGVHPYRGN